ncbi:hypothetical protein UUU_05700 [Klebsiella pneumoniae subsp. pneumoniae DSM 30104 = JCM 1662 = NBRC 14940]|nr:hypothetical protein UUU_05700 [Klebsiella pneumoniae subsp. pneumoniae DSM 30104 = JCM 1662 = NBRC 14940]
MLLCHFLFTVNDSIFIYCSVESVQKALFFVSIKLRLPLCE